MRLLISFVFLLTIFGYSSAQSLLPLNYDTLTRNHELSFNISGDVATSAIGNQILNRFVLGGEVTQDAILKFEEKHKAMNRVGFYAEPTIEYANYSVKPFKSKDWGIVVKAGALYTGTLKYAEGLYGLGFRGNEPYLGSTIDLANTNGTFTGAHKIGFGFIDAKSKSSVTLNVYGITNYMNAYMSGGHFKQDSTGYDAEIFLNGVVQNAFGPLYKGFGVGVDANFFFKIGNPEKPSYIQFNIQNFGFGIVNNRVAEYAMDTTIVHNGFTIGDLTDGNTLFGEGKEIADELGLKRDTISKTFALPFMVHVGKIIDEHNSRVIQFFYGARVYYSKGTVPMGYFGIHYRSKSWFRAGLGASYGGFTGFRMNAYLQARMENFNIGLATSDVLGMVGIGRGYSLSLTASYRF